VLHSDILPEQDCGGELIELPEDEPTYVHFAQCARLSVSLHRDVL
jgi:hypothetical protein